jgi:phosphatidylglycerol:prolipoprotein diacylglycerol transferase
LAALGLVLGWGYAAARAARAGLDARMLWRMGLYASLAGLLSARLWLVLSVPHTVLVHPAQLVSLHRLQVEGTYYGGLFGALAVIALYSRCHGVPTLRVMDHCAPALALGHAVTRLGCFAVGCCYGKPTGLPWGVIFSNPWAARLSGVPLHVRLHPTQLYEASAELANFWLLSAWLPHQRHRGQTTGAYFMLYGLERALIECLRGDPGRTLLWNGSISLMQLVSIAMIGIGLLLWRRRSPPQSLQPVVA